MTPSSLVGQVALVTGASRGIGKAIALELAANGAYVIGTATSNKGAEQIHNYLDAQNFAGTGQVLNLSEKDSIAALMESLSSLEKSPSILVNNAGITRDNLLLRMKDEEWLSVIQTNLEGVFRLTKACLKPMMKARYGRIISISSVVGSIGNAGQSNYSAAKAGVIGFSKSLAKEVASRNITVNVVSPGFIRTDMTDVIPEKDRLALEESIPAKRIGAPEDIAYAVAMFASERAGYMTGETLHVNGGMYMC